MPAAIEIEALRELRARDFAGLLTDSEASGQTFVRRLVADWASGANRFDRPGEALFAATTGDGLVACCGLNVDPYTEREGVGRVRHLYVHSAFRRLGIGERLVVQIIATAPARFDILRLRTGNPEAARLYERLGFRRADGADCSHVMDLRCATPVGHAH